MAELGFAYIADGVQKSLETFDVQKSQMTVTSNMQRFAAPKAAPK
jgi:hypothetical protein